MKKDTSFLLAIRILVVVMTIALSADLYLQERGASENQPLSYPTTHQLISKASEVRDELNRAMGLLEECFGHELDLDQIQSVPVTVTAYTSTTDQCDDTPYVTASLNSVRVGIIAVSDDLIEEYGLHFGQRVLIPGHGLFEVQDRMNPRWTRRVDIWLEDRQVALRFGKQKATLMWVAQPQPANHPELLASATRF